MRRTGTSLLSGLALATVLSACGGGGGNPGTCSASAQTCAGDSGGGGGGGGGGPVVTPPVVAPATNANGIFKGSTGTGRTVLGVVLDDSQVWVLYSVAGNASVIAGALQGTANVSGGTLTSSNIRDFNLEGLGINDASVAATYVTGQSLNGVVTYSNTTVSFASTFDAAFNTATDPALIAGTYTGQAATAGGTDTGSLSVSSGGDIAGVSALACRYSGRISPRPSGNVYDLSVTFAGGTCSNGMATVNGIAYFDAATSRVWAAALNTGRTNGFVFLGTKN